MKIEKIINQSELSRILTNEKSRDAFRTNKKNREILQEIVDSAKEVLKKRGVKVE